MTDTLTTKLDQIRANAALGGGAAQAEKQHAKGKLTARERIEKLLAWEWKTPTQPPMA
jgi:propionyl-CoA carboxylase beta chain